MIQKFYIKAYKKKENYKNKCDGVTWGYMVHIKNT